MILTALLLGLQVAQGPVSKSDELQALVAPIGDGIVASVRVESTAGRLSFGWNEHLRFDFGAGDSLFDDGEFTELGAADIVARTRALIQKEKEADESASRFRTFGMNPMLGVQSLAVGGIEAETLSAFATGRWTADGEVIVYAACLRLPRPESAEVLKLALQGLRRRAIMLAGAGVTALRRASGTMPPEFSRREGFVPTPVDAPLLDCVVARPLAHSSDDDLPLYATNAWRGAIVADIGSGNGRHARAMAEIVGPEGRVLARDPNPQASGGEGIELLRSPVDNVLIEPSTLDRAYLSQVWRIVENQETRAALLASLLRAMKAGGEVAVVQYIPRQRDRIGFTKDAIREWTEAGFEAGRRWQLWGSERDGGNPAVVIEFRRPIH
ncbi:MAG: hypothetical protein ACI835_004196 [Planctomycetota bacterium]|jgi:hypothetical protein